MPREELYEVVPAELWGELGRLITQRKEGLRTGRAEADEREAAYRRDRL